MWKRDPQASLEHFRELAAGLAMGEERATYQKLSRSF
jgi:hypothetical protein